MIDRDPLELGLDFAQQVAQVDLQRPTRRHMSWQAAKAGALHFCRNWIARSFRARDDSGQKVTEDGLKEGLLARKIRQAA
jgi:hypothetical protein